MRATVKRMKRFCFASVVLLIMAVPITLAQDGDEQIIPFETISSYNFSGHKEKKNYVIIDKQEWKSLWKIVHSIESERPPLPDIDFTQHMVIAVFFGERGISADRISVTKLTRSGKTLKVFVKETMGDTSCGWLPIAVQPYHIIVTENIKKPKKRVLFEEPDREIKECPRS
jgi:hypothetical protein